MAKKYDPRMGSNARLCARCDLTKVTGTRIECRSCGDDTYKHKGFEWQVRKTLEDHDDLKHFTYTDTAFPCAAKNASNVRRADFTYVLEDRVVVLEVDENEHRYNMPECERKREQQLADSVTGGMYVVIIRFNPMPRGIPWMQNMEKLVRVLREAFVTQEVKLADDGIHRVYVGYQMARIRKLDAAYEEVQKNALKRAREDTTTDEDTATDCAMENKVMKMMVYPTDKLARKSNEDNDDCIANDYDPVFEPDVAGDPDHLEWFQSKFCYLCNQGKFYDYETGKQYTKEKLFKRYITKKTVVQYIDKMTKKIVKKRYESARLWFKDKSFQVYFDLAHEPGKSRVIPHPVSKRPGGGHDKFPNYLLNDCSHMPAPPSRPGCTSMVRYVPT